MRLMGTMRKSPSAVSKNDAATAAKAHVQAYFAAQPPKARKALKTIRATILAVAPDATEAFSYRIPSFKIGGRALVWYAGFTHHCSLYPIGDAIRKAHAKALRGYETSKGTVRFPLDKPLPVALVKRLVKARLADAKRSS